MAKEGGIFATLYLKLIYIFIIKKTKKVLDKKRYICYN